MAKLSDDTKVWIKLERLTNAIESHAENQNRLYKTVYGDTNGEKGLIIKVDRLQQKAKNNKWLMRSISVPVLGWIITKIYIFFY